MSAKSFEDVREVWVVFDSIVEAPHCSIAEVDAKDHMLSLEADVPECGPFHIVRFVRAALLADRPEVAGWVRQLREIRCTPFPSAECSVTALCECARDERIASALESQAAQNAAQAEEIAGLKHDLEQSRLYTANAVAHYDNLKAHAEAMHDDLQSLHQWAWKIQQSRPSSGWRQEDSALRDLMDSAPTNADNADAYRRDHPKEPT